tara:strand:- start:751 stop:903 length:153 start_codon:yes stop_codon:yes gene_type:complete
MTEDEIKKELNKRISDYYHAERTKNFRKNISDSQSRSKQIQQLNKDEELK